MGKGDEGCTPRSQWIWPLKRGSGVVLCCSFYGRDQMDTEVLLTQTLGPEE